MEIINTPTDMTPLQKRALEIYCNSANIYNDYKAISFQELSEKLEKEKTPVGKSTLQRWSKKFDFKSYLDFQIQQTMIVDVDSTVQKRAISVAVEKKLVDVQRNGELSADFYEIMENYVNQVKDDFANGKRISAEAMKFAITGATMTTGREDKLLDRIANAGTDKTSSAEMLEQHKLIELDIEE